MRTFWRMAALVLVSCVSAPRTTTFSPPDNDPQASASCAERGGTWQRVCMLGGWACVEKFADAGKPCTGSKQCHGHMCIYEGEESPPPGEHVAGSCKRDNNPCGCFPLVEDGTFQGAFCAD
jgi:hypothetical protein